MRLDTNCGKPLVLHFRVYLLNGALYFSTKLKIKQMKVIVYMITF